MYAEVLGGYGLLVFLLIFIAEVSNKKPIGILASLLVIMLGVWLLGDSTIYLRTGETATLVQNNGGGNSVNTSLVGVSQLSVTNFTSYNETLTGFLNDTTNLNYTRIATYTYTPIVAAFFNITLGRLLALLFIGLGLYGTAAYSVDTFSQPVQR